MILGFILRKVRKMAQSDHQKMDLVRTGILFGIVVVLHTVAMMILEGMSLQDSIWLTMTSASTTGYGDLSASTLWGRVATIVFIYLFAIALLAKLAGDYLAYRAQKREDKRLGNVDYSHKHGHIVVMHPPAEDTEHFLNVFHENLQHNEATRGLDVVLLTEKFSDSGLPGSLSDFLLLSGSYARKKDIVRSGVENAEYVFILGDQCDSSDALASQAILTMESVSSTAKCVVEYRDPTNEVTFKQLSKGEITCLRQVRSYPELLVRAAIAPGSEKVFEELFGSDGKTLHTVVNTANNLPWKDVFINHFNITGNIPVAVDNNDGSGVLVNPDKELVIRKNAKIFYMG